MQMTKRPTQCLLQWNGGLSTPVSSLFSIPTRVSICILSDLHRKCYTFPVSKHLPRPYFHCQPILHSASACAHGYGKWKQMCTTILIFCCCEIFSGFDVTGAQFGRFCGLKACVNLHILVTADEEIRVLFQHTCHDFCKPFRLLQQRVFIVKIVGDG